ncbi:MAG: iron-containing alcohol dehydrogenase [Deltaproteobacteria bacterium]|nr:iron-containing alcohol dehydrogenase [Deltaproteobacteria bacterium]
MKFEFHNPTRVVFGAGVLGRMGVEAARLGGHALVVIGGGSVRVGGVLDKALGSLEAAGVAHTLFEGVEPNPRLTTVIRGGAAAVDCKADVVIALGGGSVMDASKVIASLPFYQGDPWDMMMHKGPSQRVPETALPIITVPTLAATGSEMNAGAVITNSELTEKSYVSAPCLYPATAIVDPLLTVSVPPDQTAYGVVDLITHVTESYFNGVGATPIQDRMAEAVVLTALEYGPKAVSNGKDVKAREQVQWASIVALNGWVQAGSGALGFPVHQIEHVLSAHTDMAHGAGLAILSPAWMRFAATRRPEKFEQFARRVFDADEAMDGIGRLEEFFRSLGCPTRLTEVEVGRDSFQRFAEDSVRVGGDGARVHGRPPLGIEDIIEILRLAA